SGRLCESAGPVRRPDTAAGNGRVTADEPVVSLWVQRSRSETWPHVMIERAAGQVGALIIFASTEFPNGFSVPGADRSGNVASRVSRGSRAGGSAGIGGVSGVSRVSGHPGRPGRGVSRVGRGAGAGTARRRPGRRRR